MPLGVGKFSEVALGVHAHSLLRAGVSPLSPRFQTVSETDHSAQTRLLARLALELGGAQTCCHVPPSLLPLMGSTRSCERREMHMEGGGPAGQRDDCDLEISDLDTPTPASSRRPGGGAPWYQWSRWSRWSQQRVALPRLVLATLVAALVTLALLTVLATGGQLAALLAPPTPVPTPDLSPF